MNKISIFDTTISSYNLGNQIIMDSIYQHLCDIFPNTFFFKLPSMEITNYTIQYILQSDLTFFGGTNSLTSEMEKYKQWGLSLTNYSNIKNVILMGTGWWQYQEEKTSIYTKYLLKHVLSKRYLHSVRDSYTENKLNEIGFKNVINTGCSTIWNLSLEHCKKIKTKKSDEVMVVFTDYKQNLNRDRYIFEVLKENYDKIYIWVQGAGDFDYVNNNFRYNIEFIAPNLNSYDELLSSSKVDYVGTRLHGGIRALQHARRTIIIGIDNRAVEMGRDFNLQVLQENKIENLDKLINSNFETRINLPLKKIKRWQKQF